MHKLVESMKSIDEIYRVSYRWTAEMTSEMNSGITGPYVSRHSCSNAVLVCQSSTDKPPFPPATASKRSSASSETRGFLVLAPSRLIKSSTNFPQSPIRSILSRALRIPSGSTVVTSVFCGSLWSHRCVSIVAHSVRSILVNQLYCQPEQGNETFLYYSEHK